MTSDAGPITRFKITVGRRKWPIVITMLVTVTGMTYSLFWAPVVRHDVVRYAAHPLFHTALVKHLERIHPIAHNWYWVTPGDIWGTLRTAQTIEWGWLGGIYSAHGGFLLPPGILFVLLPASKLVGLLHLLPSYPAPLPRPSAWLVLGPYEMLLSGVALLGLDALAERLAIPARRRAWMSVAEGMVLWQVVVIWGHPEIAVALGLTCYAIRTALDGRPVATGWLLGAALAMQTFVVLIIPVILAASISRTSLAGNAVGNTVSTDTAANSSVPDMLWAYTKQAFSILWRAISVPAVLVATPLITQPRATWRALVVQPTYPKVDHPTPWLALAPKLTHTTVSGGVTRLFAIAVACVIGYALFMMARHGADIERLVPVACAMSFFAWCFFESVMTSYYIIPATAFALLAASMLSHFRLVGALAMGMLATVLAFQHTDPWLYWGMVTSSLALACVLGIPTGSRLSPTTKRLPAPVNITVKSTPVP